MILDTGTIKAINLMLNLHASGNEQDWELELADEHRLGEFISFLTETNLTSQEKYAVLSLILASYNDFLALKVDDDLVIWNKIIQIIDEDVVLYTDILNYWAIWTEVNEDDLFVITPLVRSYVFSRRHI